MPMLRQSGTQVRLVSGVIMARGLLVRLRIGRILANGTRFPFCSAWNVALRLKVKKAQTDRMKDGRGCLSVHHAMALTIV